MAKEKKVRYAKVLRDRIEEQKSPRPKPGDIAFQFIQEVGGTKHFCELLAKEYWAAKSGSMTRQRILALIFIAMKQSDEDLYSVPLEDLSDDDIENQLAEAMKRLTNAGAINAAGHSADPPSEEKEEPVVAGGTGGEEAGGPPPAEDPAELW